MPRFLKWSIRLMAVMVLGTLAASIALAMWLDRKVADPKFAGDFARQISTTLGANVTIGSLDFYWPGRLHCEHLTLRLDDDPPDAPFAVVDTVNLLLAPSSLWTRRLQFREIRILQPHFALHRQADGTLALPRGAGANASSSTPKSGTPPPGGVDEFEITGAVITLMEADGRCSLSSEDVDLRGTLHSLPSGIEGDARLTAGKVILHNGLEIIQLTSELHMVNGNTTINNTRATVGGASVAGKLSIHPDGNFPRIRFSASAENVSRGDLSQFLDLPGYLDFDGAGATLEGGSSFENPGSMSVTGKIVAHGTRLDANQLLERTGLRAAFPGWEALRMGDTTADLLHADGFWHLANITTASPDPSTSVSGSIAFASGGRSTTHLAWTLPFCGGTNGGTFRHEGNATSLPYNATVTLRGVNFSEFLRPFNVRLSSANNVHPLDEYLQGSADAELRFAGDFRKPGATANGTVSVQALTLTAQQLLKDSGVAADLPELRSINFGTVTGGFAITNRTTRFVNFRSDGKGTARLGFGFTLNPAGPAATDLTLDLPVFLGRLQGRFSQKSTNGRSRPFSLGLNATALDAPALLRAFRVDPSTLQGRITASFAGSGDLATPGLLKGAGTLAIRPAKIEHTNVFTLLATMLAMPGVGSFNLDSVDTDYRIANRTIHLSQIRSAPETRNHFTGQGTVGFDGAFDLKGLLIINSGAPGFVGNTLYSMGLRANRGTFRVPFTVKGAAGKPAVAIDATGLSGSAARSIFDNIPVFNRLPGLFEKKKPTRPQAPHHNRETTDT